MSSSEAMAKGPEEAAKADVEAAEAESKGTKRAAEEEGDGVSPEAKALEKRICEELKEDNAYLVQLILEEVGVEEGEQLLAKTLEVEKTEEGIKTADGERRKTAGGVYFHLAREKLGANKFNVLTNRVRKQRKLNKKPAAPAAEEDDKKPTAEADEKDQKPDEEDKTEDKKEEEEPEAKKD